MPCNLVIISETEHLGQRRAARTFFLEAPRQMGKTSILRFVEKGVPSHVLAVYVYLEQQWSDDPSVGVPNLWQFLIDRILATAGVEGTSLVGPARADDLTETASRVCEKLGKSYVLLLLDEFRVLLERASNVGAVLSEFRGFHDDPQKRIAMLMADRLTRQELELRCAHDLWGQLTPERVGPLDRDAVAKVLSTLAIGEPESDVVWPPETVQRLHDLTSGYPYHVVRAAQKSVDRLWETGPWVIALPEDVDAVAGEMIEDDQLFQQGLCRPDRIDETLEDAIAAVLDWRDLLRLIDELTEDEPNTLGAGFADWRPTVRDFVAHLGPRVLERLVAVGLTRPVRGTFEVFSPLLERWLRRMRSEGRSLRHVGADRLWSVSRLGDGVQASHEDWQNLDASLIKRCQQAGGRSPLRPKVMGIDEWKALTAPVSSRESFRSFLDAAYRLLIDDREEREAMRRHPRLYLAYHLLRLVRNYHVHGSRTHAAQNAWDQLCTRALRRDCRAYEPVGSEEWTAVSQEILRQFFTAIRDAVMRAGIVTR